MAVPKHTDRYASQKISVGFPIGVPYCRPLTTNERYGVASVGLDNDLLSLGNNILVGHVGTPICGDHIARWRSRRQAITRGKDEGSTVAYSPRQTQTLFAVWRRRLTVQRDCCYGWPRSSGL